MQSTPIPFPLPELARSLTSLPGIGPATGKALAARGLRTWGDALFFLPKGYQDRRVPRALDELAPGLFAVVRGRVISAERWGKAGRFFRMVIGDESGRLALIWFNYKRAHVREYKTGDGIFAVGEVGAAPMGGLQMTHPELHRAEEVGPDHAAIGRLVPVYPAMEGVKPGVWRKAMAALIERVGDRIPDPLFGLLDREVYPLAVGSALVRAHSPSREAEPQDLDPEKALWLRTLAFNELLFFELGLVLKRALREASPGRALEVGSGRSEGGLAERFVQGLPFVLTPGQEEAIRAVRGDLSRPRPMGRILSGDVGTGKTVVALAAALMAAQAGVQTAFMAPTEVLARQHLATISAAVEPLGLEPVYFSGSQNGAERKEAMQSARQGRPLVVGTHALFSQEIEFQDLALVIIDEQHRFGVHQRMHLSSKGREPHLLVLSATPIPRTLALALAGHLDISDLPQRPGGRPPVETRVLAYDQRRQALDEMERRLGQGGQVYVICPLVESSDSLEAQDVETTYANLGRYFEKYPVGLLHGRMSGAEQEAALHQFKVGESRILVATTVVEVGVDVPGATLMVVLAAERFGLSQLHQLRGRVGRGESPGLCLLVAGPDPGALALKRLGVLAANSGGADVAEADLFLRGPGDALGASQAGLPPFRVADWARDKGLVETIRGIIAKWQAEDPVMAGTELDPVKRECLRRWGRRLGLALVG